MLNQYTVKILSRHSALNLDNPNYRFSELMTDITIAYEESTASNSGKSSTFSVIAPYGAVRGHYITQAAPGVNKSGTATLSISVGESISGKTINIAYSDSTSYSVTGPTDGTTLLNGKTATHRVAFLVLFGTLCQNSKGQYYISAGTGDLMDFTTLAHINGYVYCHNTDNTMINYSATISAFKQRIKQYPKHYLALN